MSCPVSLGTSLAAVCAFIGKYAALHSLGKTAAYIKYPQFWCRNWAAPGPPGMSKCFVTTLRTRNSPLAGSVRIFIVEGLCCAAILLADLKLGVPHGIDVAVARTAHGIAAHPD